MYIKIKMPLQNRSPTYVTELSLNYEVSYVRP